MYLPAVPAQSRYDSLIKFKEIVDEMGGIESAQAALTALEKLRD